MIAFTQLSAIGIPIDIANCDTDQIVPARFLRYLPEDGGYDRYFFHDLRFTEDGRPRGDFIYDRAPYCDGQIIVADVNWGCGSSRESAVYGLVANGIRVVIAPSFGDIHYSNCMKYGVLPVRLPRTVCDDLRRQLHASPGATLSVDLEAQQVTGPDGLGHGFEIRAFDRYRMLNGLDDIGVTLEYADAIEAFEARHAEAYDWL